MPSLQGKSGCRIGLRSLSGGRAATPVSGRAPPARSPLCLWRVFGEGDGKGAPLKLGLRGEEGSREEGRKAFLAEAKTRRQGFHGGFQEARPQWGVMSCPRLVVSGGF